MSIPDDFVPLVIEYLDLYDPVFVSTARVLDPVSNGPPGIFSHPLRYLGSVGAGGFESSMRYSISSDSI